MKDHKWQYLKELKTSTIFLLQMYKVYINAYAKFDEFPSLTFKD